MILTDKQLQEIAGELKNPYYGQLVYLAKKYNITPEYMRKIKERLRKRSL